MFENVLQVAYNLEFGISAIIIGVVATLIVLEMSRERSPK